MPETDIATRAFIIALKAPPVSKSSREIHYLTGVNPRTVNAIYARAIERGFELNQIPLRLENKHVEDAPRSGRPRKRSGEAAHAINGTGFEHRSLAYDDVEDASDDRSSKAEAHAEAQS